MRTRLLRPLAVAALLLVALPACSDDAPEDPDASGPSETVTEVTVEPGTATGYEGARADVTDLRCERDGERWTVAGTVRNPPARPAAYRISPSFLAEDNDTRGLVQTDVSDLGPDEQQEWAGELEIGGDDLSCVLRVERTPAG